MRVEPAPRPAARCFAMANVGLFPTRAAGPSLHAADEGACCDACDACASDAELAQTPAFLCPLLGRLTQPVHSCGDTAMKG